MAALLPIKKMAVAGGLAPAELDPSTLVRDEREDALNLPKYEVPLLLYDRFLRSDGQMEHPVSGDRKWPWVPEVIAT